MQTINFAYFLSFNETVSMCDCALDCDKLLCWVEIAFVGRGQGKEETVVWVY